MSDGIKRRGFGAMDKERQRAIASKGGSSLTKEQRSFSKDPDLARRAGAKGGAARKKIVVA